MIDAFLDSVRERLESKTTKKTDQQDAILRDFSSEDGIRKFKDMALQIIRFQIIFLPHFNYREVSGGRSNLVQGEIFRGELELVTLSNFMSHRGIPTAHSRFSFKAYSIFRSEI